MDESGDEANDCTETIEDGGDVKEHDEDFTLISH
jgi:hypothetical protein